MTWIGKVGGGVLGFMAGGPVGALIGTALGHQFDRGAAGPGGGFIDWSGTAPTSAERERLLFETTFQALGHLAKADGRVSEEEIDAARSVMRDMRLGEAATARAIECFTLGKQPGFPIRARLAVLRRACGGQPAALQQFLSVQVNFLLGQGPVTAAERAAMLRLAADIGVGRLELARLDALLRTRSGGRREAAPPSMSVPAAYRALGVTPDASDRQVKTAYRRLMNQHHPDKHAGRNLPAAELERSRERTHEIRSAWELIREQRRLR